MVAWTRFKLLLAMVTTLMTMVAAAAECQNIESVFLQDPHTGEQYQFGEINVLPRALFGRAVHAAELSKSKLLILYTGISQLPRFFQIKI
ncbi:hypothetical protein N7491_004921 [Penicillium cf. griseofulvum]|nr:hypothetical protein N7491_004921 [Penicillium cf. griseofulvum]